MLPMSNTNSPLSSLTLDAVKSYHRDPKTQELKDALYLARLRALTVRAIVDELLAAAFAETDYRHEYNNTRIECERDLYLVADDVDLSPWDTKRAAVLTAAGFEIVDGKCPALVAEAAVDVAKRALLVHACEHFGLEFKRIRDVERAVELFSAGCED